MSNDEWVAWRRKHESLFKIPGDVADSTRMFAAWREVFEGIGYTAQELHAATMAIAANPPDGISWREKQLAAIHSAIREKRRRDWEAESERLSAGESELGKPCEKCNGAGLVVVPHLVCVQDSKWIPHAREGYQMTFAVICDCPRGRQVYQKDQQREAKHRRMTIEQYSVANPTWPSQLLQREKDQRAELEATYQTKKVDGTLDEVLEGIGKPISK